jgi:hypothetical protein
MSPQPGDKSDAFAVRILAHDRIATPRDLNDKDVWVLAVNDQLIVKKTLYDSGVLSPVAKTFPKGSVDLTKLTDVFGGDVSATDEYVVVEAHGLTDPRHGIFDLLEHFRTDPSLLKVPRYEISPNHIMVPAAIGGAGCPYGPPFPASPWIPPPLPASSDSPVVTVIDSSYQDWWSTSVTTRPSQTPNQPETYGPWGDNPLADHCDLHPIQLAPWLKGTGPSLTANNFVAAVSGVAPLPPGVGWVTSSVGDVPAAREAGLLDALAGHANFVAGVIAQGCDYPTMEVWTHHGSFVNQSDFSFATEAAVCRSIVLSQTPGVTNLPTTADVIHVGFAFALHNKNVSVKQGGDFLSGVWTSTLNQVAAICSSAGRQFPMIVAPAGNEGVTTPFFPAALHAYFSANAALYNTSATVFENVIGVGSLGPKPDQNFHWPPNNALSHDLHYHKISMTPYDYGASTFSNSGPWVTCAAIGEDVHSVFMPLSTPKPRKMRREEDEQQPRQAMEFKNAAAIWNGTSFAAPKISAAIAARVSATGSPAAAWNSLVQYASNATPKDSVQLGLRFDNL